MKKDIKGRGDGSHIDYYITREEYYYNNGVNKAVGVYLRSSLEFILKQFCFNRVPIPFAVDTSKIKTDVFCNYLNMYKNDRPGRCGFTPTTNVQLDHFTKLVLNPLSHHDVINHEIRAEIRSAINTIKTLKNELGV